MGIKSLSIVKMSRQQKIEAAINATAIRLAKEANDPKYKQYERARQKALKLKKEIVRKYRAKARRIVMAILGGGKSSE